MKEIKMWPISTDMEKNIVIGLGDMAQKIMYNS